MIHFLIAWGVSLVGIKIYLTKKKIKIGISNDVISLVLSLILITFLYFIQFIFGFLTNILISVWR